MFRFPDIIGFYSVAMAIRRASDAFLSSPPALFSRDLLANPRAMGGCLSQFLEVNVPPAKIGVFRARAPRTETSDNKTL